MDSTTIAFVIWGIALLYVAVHFLRSVRMVPNRSSYIAERLGKYHATLGPGFHVLLPFIDKVAYVLDLKEETIEVPPQEAFTKDNVKVEVDGVLYLSVMNPVNAAYGITNYRFAASQLAQTTTRSVIGTLELDRTFEERDLINTRVLEALGEVQEAWGIQVHRYEVKGIVPPPSVRDAMERQMSAERERRARIAKSEGDKASRINESEGTKMESINRSEGEMKRRINEAEGKAAEILSIARATAESIEKMGASLVAEGGTEAVHMRLSQLYIQQLASLGQKSTELVLPADLTDVQALLSRLDHYIDGADQSLSPAAAPTPPATRKTLPPTSVMRAPVAPAEAAETLREMVPVARPKPDPV